MCCSLGVSNTFSKHVRQRYERHFGRANRHIPVANHSFILLDSPGIVDEDYIRAGHGISFEEWIPLRDGPIEFVKGLAAGLSVSYALSLRVNMKLITSRNMTVEEQLGPVILFSHIPLHRAESKKCGPLRERGTIDRGVGHGWQKTLGKQTSSFLLENLRPTVIFRYAFSLTLQYTALNKSTRSADDRDYCDATHKLPGSGKETHEITVKSFSRARHIKQPGFHLLSLYPGRTPSHAHAPCLLPRADGTFTRLYIPAAGLTVLILIIAHMKRARRAARLRLAPASPLPCHVDPSEPSPSPPTHLPSPYSASSAYSYSYAYSNMPPGSQQGRDRILFDLPRRDSSKLAPPGGLRTFGKPRPPPLRPLPPPAHEEDENDGVRAHYLCVPPASPVPGDLLPRRPLARTASAIAIVTSPSARAWSFTYTFTIRGRRRRIAVHAPAWWPQWAGGTRRKGNGACSAVGRDLWSVMAPALATWVFLVWWYSA